VKGALRCPGNGLAQKKKEFKNEIKRHENDWRGEKERANCSRGDWRGGAEKKGQLGEVAIF